MMSQTSPAGVLQFNGVYLHKRQDKYNAKRVLGPSQSSNECRAYHKVLALTLPCFVSFDRLHCQMRNWHLR